MVTEKRLIDVNKVIDEMQKCIDESPYARDSIAVTTFGAIIDYLKKEPTVDAVEVVHGRWEQGDMYDYGDVCSRCDWDSAIEPCDFSYCPNCGAKMDGESE